ncbi:MAG: hypothetical protein QM811_13145 [Pirellulales bacterium]
MEPFVNIAAYRFAALYDLKPLRARLLSLSKELDLRGTILISPEGINLFVAGKSDPIERLLNELRAISGLEDLAPKYSESADRPFRRMLVASNARSSRSVSPRSIRPSGRHVRSPPWN